MRHVALLAAVMAVMLHPGSSQVAGETRNSNHLAFHQDEFGDPRSARCLIVLHGASGLALPLYEQQARYFSKQGFHVLLPHYFDATHSDRSNLDNQRKWVGVVDEVVAQCRQQPTTEQVFLLGFSLGASVALAAGSQGSAVEGIADWYGSLPDEFFFTMKSMPPLLILHGEQDTNIPIVNGQQLVRLCEIKQIDCDHKFYPDQGHGFSGGALQDADRRTLDFFAAHSTRTKMEKGPF